MKSNKYWEDQFDRVIMDRDYFGYNVEVSKKILKKLANFGGTLEVLGEYTIRVELPFQRKARDKTLLFLLTMAPMPTECRYNNKKDQLTVEWHY